MDECSISTFKQWRDEFLTAWSWTGESVLSPAMHYITNHLWEDFTEWGCMQKFLEEAGEASQARDNH